MDEEALIAVRIARKLNKTNKAKKLFQHALTLSPNNHDVFLHYGEFLESCQDIINADHFYLKAMLIKSNNSRAAINRKRTLPIVNQLDFEKLKRIDAKKNKISLNWLNDKETYFQHIHHTVAIEGNTISLPETRKIIEMKLTVPGKSVLEHNEIFGINSALHYINDTLANNKLNINIRDVLEIHKRIMQYVDPPTAGTFRKTQVFVGEYTPPPATKIENLMFEFIKALESTVLHPIHIAAFAHYKLVSIHPFVDGNGRTSRLLMNLILMKYGYPPIIIRKEDKCQYFKLLQTAHESDYRLFYRFITQGVEETIDKLLQEKKR